MLTAFKPFSENSSTLIQGKLIKPVSHMKDLLYNIAVNISAFKRFIFVIIDQGKSKNPKFFHMQ